MPQPYGPGQDLGDDTATLSELPSRGLPGQRPPTGPWQLASGEAVILAGDATTANRIQRCLDVAGITAATVVLAQSWQLERQRDPVE
ncbi:hypothetical protein [Micromonospora sp. LOL_023]|uniref:hypothetical protein n=1 Tax=Micromonospora sp. LOL_023 TaxID=3345418 RepID=UPI003A8768EC